jgi:hypothetical protein
MVHEAIPRRLHLVTDTVHQFHGPYHFDQSVKFCLGKQHWSPSFCCSLCRAVDSVKHRDYEIGDLEILVGKKGFYLS